MILIVSKNFSVCLTASLQMIRVLSIVVGVFVCTWYFCVVSVHIALSLKLKEQYMDYIMTFNVSSFGNGSAFIAGRKMSNP